MKTITKIDTYFSQKGIKTIYNTLGANELLVRAYVSDYYSSVDKHPRKHSNYNKISDYSKMYTFSPRQKMTGFENFIKTEKNFKQEISKFIVEGQNSPLQLIYNNEHDQKLNYKQQLVNFCKTVENPLLYLSGGLDSELVANSFLEGNNKFKVVIFEWLDNNGYITNGNEIFYAYRYCQKHNLIPIIKKINIDQLWNSNEFKKFAIDLQIFSPHLCTHAYMIKLMSEEFSNVTHVFGGEVKFKTNYLLDNGQKSNLVWLDKVVPQYDNQVYTCPYAGYQQTASIALYYTSCVEGGFTEPWSWEIYGSPGYIFDNNNPSTAKAGIYATPPAGCYEVRAYVAQISDSASNFSYSLINGGNWTSFEFSDGIVCGATATAPSYYSYGFINITFGIEVRVIGETTPVQSSTVNFVPSSLWV